MKQKELLLLSVTVFLTAVAWVIIEVTTIRNNTPDTTLDPNSVVQKQIDIRVFDTLKNKQP
jgi:hypothetical protein